MLEPLDYYLVCIPLVGAVSAVGVGDAASNVKTGLIVSPVGSLRMHHSVGAEHLLMKIPTTTFDMEYQRLTGRTSAERIVFDPVLQITITDPLFATYRTIVESMSRFGERVAPLELRRQLESSLVMTLVLTRNHSATDILFAGDTTSSSDLVEHAIDLIHTNYHEELTVSDIAVRLGVSLRKLQIVFHKATGSTPSQYLKNVRLEAARHALLTHSTSDCTVADICHRVGISHPGRFAVAYRARYGVSPSDTLRLREG